MKFFYFLGKQTHAYIKETKSLTNRIERAPEFSNSIKNKRWGWGRKIKLDSVCMWSSTSTCFPFPFLFLSFLDSFLVFSYAYGGLHRWSPHEEKAAKVRFDSQRIFICIWRSAQMEPTREKAAKVGFDGQRKQKKKKKDRKRKKQWSIIRYRNTTSMNR